MAQLGGRHQPQFEAELPKGDGRAPGVLRREHLGELLGREEAGLPQEFPQGDFPWFVRWHMTLSSNGRRRAPAPCSARPYHSRRVGAQRRVRRCPGPSRTSREGWGGPPCPPGAAHAWPRARRVPGATAAWSSSTITTKMHPGWCVCRERRGARCVEQIRTAAGATATRTTPL